LPGELNHRELNHGDPAPENPTHRKIESEAAGFLLITGTNGISKRQPPQLFLLMEHHDRWDLPKGHVEPGETLMQAAMRETFEETGIETSAIDVFTDFQFSDQYRVRYEKPVPKECWKQTTIFLGVVSQPFEVVLTEHTGYRWFPWSPPHQIQPKMIDPLLAAVQQFFQRSVHQDAPQS